jgi:hypothetical protein
MTGERHKVHVQFLHVNGHMRCALCRIHENGCAAGSGTLDQFRDIVDTSQHVGNLGHRHHPGVFRKCCVHLFLGDCAVRLTLQKDQLCSGGTGNHLPRQDVAVMFHDGNQDLIPGFQICHAVAVCHQVHTLCCVPGEDDLFRTGSMDEPLYSSPGSLIAFGRLHAQRIQPTQYIGVVFLIELLHCIQNALGFLRSCRIIEIDPVGVPEQDKILPHFFRIPCCHLKSPLQ